MTVIKFDYDKIEINQSFLYAHNPIFKHTNEFGVTETKIFPLKLLLPDYIYENFNLLEESQKRTILGFIKIFISRIMDYNFDTSNYVYYRKFFYSVYLNENANLINKKNIKLIFPFKNEIKVFNYYGKWVENVKDNVSLGKTKIFSKLLQSKPLGKRIFLPSKNTAIELSVKKEEYELFLSIIKSLGLNFLWMLSKKDDTKISRYLLIISEGKCKLIQNCY